MSYKLIFVILLCFLTSCDDKFTPVKISCPPSPDLLPISVQDGQLDRTEVEKVIQNHQTLWEYIHQLKKLGCTADISTISDKALAKEINELQTQNM